MARVTTMMPRSSGRTRVNVPDEISVELFHLTHDDSGVEALLDPSARSFAQPRTQCRVLPQSRDIVAKRADGPREQSGFFVHDDVAGAAGVHGGNRHAEGARLEEHAAQ